MTFQHKTKSLPLQRTLGAMAAAITTTLMAAGSAHAQLAATPGYYVGGNVSQSHLKDDSPLVPDTDRSDTGYKFYGGYQFTPNFALEAGYAGLGKFQAPSGDVKARGLYLDAVGTVPLAPQWSALGRVGVVDTESKISGSGLTVKDHDTGLKVGAGLQYDFSPSTALRGEWERYRVGMDSVRTNVDQYSLGLVVKF